MSAVSLFVFGVACRVAPLLTIVILNGCFSFPIGSYLFSKVLSFLTNKTSKKTNCSTPLLANQADMPTADDLNDEINKLTDNQDHTSDGNTTTTTSQKSTACSLVLTFMETGAFFMQIIVVILVPVLLMHVPSNTKEYPLTVPILIPITLIMLSVVWSGWITSWLKNIETTKRNSEYDCSRSSDKIKSNKDELMTGKKLISNTHIMQ